MKRINIHVVTVPVFLIAFVFLIASLPAGSLLGPRVTLAASVTVNSTTDVADGNTTSIANLIANPGADGVISLREAMQAANNTAGLDTINFNIAGPGVRTINVTSGLPSMNQPVVIDGSTQPLFAGAPLIELNGLAAGGDGLVFLGGGSTVRSLIINRFTGNGLLFQNTGNNVIAGNYIGTDATGMLARPNGQNGIQLLAGTTTIGGLAPADRNVISGNSQNGIVIQNGSASNNLVQGNFIGTNATGLGALGNAANGIRIDAPAERIGGGQSGARNIISGNGQAGVLIVNSGSDNNRVQGNYIGTNVSGTSPLPNLFGVFIGDVPAVRGVSNGFVGTDGDGLNDATEGNLISGNTNDGLTLTLGGTTNNRVAGNLIGTNAAGTAALANGGSGVVIEQSAGGNIIGTNGDGISDSLEKNVISGNGISGVTITGSVTNANSVAGNFIGTNAAGTASIPNGGSGVQIEGGAGSNTVGGALAVSRNLISGNGSRGVAVIAAATTGNTIRGNFIGTDVGGTLALGNNTDGVNIDLGSNCAVLNNVISGNNSAGIRTAGLGLSNSISGNFIGTDLTGTLPVPNGTQGLNLGSAGGIVGGPNPGLGNTIAFNTLSGIAVIGNGSRNSIFGNSIFLNGGLGIDLGGDGITDNDLLDLDVGPNGLQNFPVITDARQGSTIIQFTLSSISISNFRVEFFVSPVPDPTSFGEGRIFLGSMDVSTNIFGNFTGTFTLGTTLAAGQVVAATATNLLTNSTSEFSKSHIVLAPTAVKFAEASAVHYESGNVVEWRTGYETDNLGFDVYREVNDRRAILTPQMVAGSALFAADHTNLTAGKPYVWVDRNAPANAIYWVEDIDLNGARQLHGPIVPQPATGKELNARSSLLLSELGKGTAVNPAETAVPATRRLTLAAGASALASAPLFKLAVDHDGWYRVSLPETSRSQLGKLSRPQLSSGGQAFPFRLAPGNVLEFYGQGLDTPTSGERIYWLTTGLQAGPQIPQIRAGLTDEKGPASFSFTVERRDHTIYTSSLLNGEAENIFGPVVNGSPLVQSLNLKAVDTSQAGTMEVRIQGLTAGAHSVHVLLGGVELGVVQLSNKENLSNTFTIPPQTLHEGPNEVTLQSSNGPADVSLVDRVRLTYAHLYAADNDQLRFTMAAGLPAKISGFTAANINVFDITDPVQVTELLVDTTSDGGSFGISLPAAATARTLLALAGEKSTTTLTGQLTTRSNWQKSSHRADLVLITHADFRTAAERLAAHRRTQGLLVEVADVEDLFNEFSDGVHTPQAIRDFLEWAVSHWQKAPRYVLLMGDATWDPRDYLGRGRADFVPTRLIDTALMETSSDDWLVDFNQDSVPELAIGRLPVRTAEEAESVVDKLLRYDQAVPTVDREAVFVADAGFESLSAQEQALVPAGQPLRVINRAESTDAETRARILTALNAGPRLVNFVGHGSVTVWTGAGLLRSADAASLSNRDHPSVMIMLTCLNGYAADVFVVSLGEALLLAPNGGAAAVWASSGLTDPQSQQDMARRLYQQLAAGSLRLGDALMAAKAATGNPDVRRTWLLLGDPTMSFSWPTNRINRKGR